MKYFGYTKLTVDQAKAFIVDCYIGILKRYPEKNVLESSGIDIASGKINCQEFLSRIIRSEEASAVQGGVPLHEMKYSYPSFEFRNIGSFNKVKNIVYLGFSNNRPIGGMKVIIKHIEIINTLFKDTMKASLFFPENSSFDLSWLKKNIVIKRDQIINASEDLIVVPEMWALSYASNFEKVGVRYCLLVQNGYLLFNEISGIDKKSLDRLASVYSNANVVMSISDDTTRCLNAFIPDINTKLIQLSTSIDSNLFYPKIDKKNIITFMSRKLSYHSAWVVNQLIRRLDASWSIEAINNISETSVADILGVSKIFMSFSDLEGLGLPPLEAAFSGNKVIGYSGQGGREYWKPPIFEEIEMGNLLSFFDSVFEETKRLNNGTPCSIYSDYMGEMEKLKDRYSFNNELTGVKKFLSSISKSDDF